MIDNNNSEAGINVFRIISYNNKEKILRNKLDLMAFVINVDLESPFIFKNDYYSPLNILKKILNILYLA